MNRVLSGPKEKISPEFSARLNNLGRDQKVGAILVVNGSGSSGKRPTRRGSPVTRQSAIAEWRQVTAQALPQIDTILKRFGGHRARKPDALGTIPVETTPAGIKALAALKYVQAILENQRISLLK